jgi:hypothetical protein
MAEWSLGIPANGQSKLQAKMPVNENEEKIQTYLLGSFHLRHPRVM